MRKDALWLALSSFTALAWILVYVPRTGAG